MPEEMQLPFETGQFLDYLSSNVSMIAIILLAAILALVGFAKMKQMIMPLGIAIIAACQVVQVIQLIFPL